MINRWHKPSPALDMRPGGANHRPLSLSPHILRTSRDHSFPPELNLLSSSTSRLLRRAAAQARSPFPPLTTAAMDASSSATAQATRAATSRCRHRRWWSDAAVPARDRCYYACERYPPAAAGALGCRRAATRRSLQGGSPVLQGGLDATSTRPEMQWSAGRCDGDPSEWPMGALLLRRCLP